MIFYEAKGEGVRGCVGVGEKRAKRRREDVIETKFPSKENNLEDAIKLLPIRKGERNQKDLCIVWN